MTVNTACRCIYKCKLRLYYKKQKPYINNIQNVMVLAVPLWRKRTITTVTNAKFKSQHLPWHGSMFVPTAKVTCTSVKARWILRCTYAFWSHICYHLHDIFFRNISACFSKTMPRHLMHVTTARLCSKRVQVLVSHWTHIVNYQVQSTVEIKGNWAFEKLNQARMEKEKTLLQV